MNRTPPAAVRRELRQEVNYGCPVPGCGEPFLSWHHFAPPWHIREHHDPAGMIALCWKHHKVADQGVFSEEELRRFKTHPNDTSAIASRFDWLARRLVIRLGGCYAVDSCQVAIEGVPVLNVEPSSTGLLSVSFVLEDSTGRIVASMRDNEFSFVPDQVSDVEVSVSGHRIRVWVQKRGVGFDCAYTRKSVDELERLILEDQAGLLTDEDFNYVSPPEPIVDPQRFYDELAQLTDFMDVAAIGRQRSDPVGTFVRWHAARHRSRDGRIPVLDFVSCRLQHAGQIIEMRDGRMENLQFCAGNRFAFARTGFSF